MTQFEELDPETQAEIDAMLSDRSIDSLMDRDDTPAPDDQPQSTDQMMDSATAAPRSRMLRSKDKSTGVIIQVTNEEVLVELGPKQEGVCPIAQFDSVPKCGDRMEFTVLRFNRNEGLYVLIRAGAVQKGDWENLEEGQVVLARVTGTNKGGLEMEVAGHRAFMPAGQVSLWHVDQLEDLLEESMACEVVEFDRRSKNIVLSRRAVLEREREEQREKLWETIEPGQDLEGTVRKLMPFGAFVDLGGVDGLIHISDLSYQRVKDPSEVVSEGQAVTVRVLKVDKESNRVGLGLKQTQTDPYESSAASINPGDRVTGTITRITNFGAFVEIQPGVEGLIHISELGHERVNRVDQVVQEGEVVTVEVLDVDHDSRRISLSLKAMKQGEEEEMSRQDDPSMAKLRARFGSGPDQLKGGIE